MNIFEAFASYAKKDWTNFSMSNNWVGTIKDFGALTPIYFNQVIAGDTWKMAHNVICKLPPLVAPAFTRIKGVINSFYVSYASVWKHWNSFISDKPEDSYLNRSLLSAYKGRFVEPCVSSELICAISKIAYGNIDNFVGISSDTPTLHSRLDFYSTAGDVSSLTSSLYRNSVVWSVDSNGLRKATLVPNSNVVSELDMFFPVSYSEAEIQQSNFLPSYQEVANTSYSTSNLDGVSSLERSCFALGFADDFSMLVSACQSVVRNLEAHGVPCSLMAHCTFEFYRSNKLFNLLPFIAESSVWENFYRDIQNQSPEFDFSEVNGHLVSLSDSQAQSVGLSGSDVTGWRLRMDNFPLNSKSSQIYYEVDNWVDAFCLLTGYYLRSYTLNKLVFFNQTNSVLFPSHYNGLLVTKFRNFEKDYFTSASVDPMQGVGSVNVPSTIEALRTASKLEEFLERSASARDFYNFMKYNFGTSPESTKYKKPLLLGTKIISVQIGEQLQTSQSTETSPLGERAGIADGYGNGGTCDHYFNEHGIVVSYLSFVLDSQYMQGLPHYFQHHLQLDYPFPDFANLGAESIDVDEVYFGDYVRGSAQLNKDAGSILQVSALSNSNPESVKLNVNTPSGDSVTETPSRIVSSGGDYTRIYRESNDLVTGFQFNQTVFGTSSYLVNNNTTFSRKVFGYVPRYSKWKWHQDVVCGQMRTDMEYWHTFRNFSQAPHISHSFISYEDAGFTSDLNRIFAVVNDNSDKFILDIFNNCSVRRCLPLVANPSLN